jgi:hypothetical protein
MPTTCRKRILQATCEVSNFSQEKVKQNHYISDINNKSIAPDVKITNELTRYLNQ